MTSRGREKENLLLSKGVRPKKGKVSLGGGRGRGKPVVPREAILSTKNPRGWTLHVFGR